VTLMLMEGVSLKTIADQLGHPSVVLTADTYLSVAVELGLKSAAEAACLVLNAGKRPPGGGHIRRRGALALVEITVSRSETRSRAVSWGFAAGSMAWLGPSRGAVVARLPVAEVPVRPAGGAGPV
jgi:hypothetical protein